MVVESPLKIGFFRVGRVELLLKKKKTSHEKGLKDEVFVGRERFDKTEQRDFGREVVLRLVVVKLVDLVHVVSLLLCSCFF